MNRENVLKSRNARRSGRGLLKGTALSLVVILVTCTFFVADSRAQGASTTEGEVTLPLVQYMELVRQAREVRQARAPEPALVELVAEHLDLRLDEDVLTMRSEYRIEVRGEPTQAAELQLASHGSRVSVERLDSSAAGAASSARSTRTTVTTGAALHRQGDKTLFTTDTAGSYRVVIEGSRELRQGQLQLGTVLAPVATLTLDLPPDRRWTCDNAVVVSEGMAEGASVDGRRRVELALEQGRRYVLSFPQRGSQAALDTLARAVGVTFVEIDRSGVRRHDVLATEVLRGALEGFEVTLPVGLELEAVATDEGEMTPWLGQDHQLEVGRQHRLTGHGYLALTSRRLASSEEGVTRVDLTPLDSQVRQRTRYLVLLTSAAIEEPQLPEVWTRVDVTDLPVPLHQDLEALRPALVWRAATPEVGGELVVQRLPEVATANQVIQRRESISLLTVDGSLVVRDRFLVRSTLSTLDVELPVGMQLWTVSVANEAVRPLLRDGRSTPVAGGGPASAGERQLYSIPLGFRSGLGTGSGSEVWVEVVSMRNLAPGAASWRDKSRLKLELASVTAPVLMHDWRVLLPEGGKYRYAGGDLLPLSDLTAPVHRGRGWGWGWSGRNRREAGEQSDAPGNALIRVEVDDGTPLPGATLTLELAGVARKTATTDTDGDVIVRDLPPGTYTVRCELAGMKTIERSMRVKAGQVTQLELEMSLESLEESILIDADPERFYSNTFLFDSMEEERVERDQDFVKEQFGDLRQGLAGGAKPLPVQVPERGKLLELGGVLPPARLAVEIDVKARR